MANDELDEAVNDIITQIMGSIEAVREKEKDVNNS